MDVSAIEQEKTVQALLSYFMERFKSGMWDRRSGTTRLKNMERLALCVKKGGEKDMKKRLVVWMIVLAFILSVATLTLAQETKPAGPPPVVKEMVSKAKAAIKSVSAEDVKAAIDKKEKAVILDVRDLNEYEAGHLPGAINVSRGTLEFNIWNKVPDQNAKIYVYCKTGGRSALATKTLNDLGYKNAILMDALFEDWIKKGYPVER
jgi:rhodanese-related sulfurtransferase